jgi:plastocyanin
MAVACLLGSVCASKAATVTVSMSNFSFSPASKTVDVGDTVKWVNSTGTGHTATSRPGDPAQFDSGTLFQGQSFSFTFTKAGSYPYICVPHQSFGMTGTITVQSVAVPPTVSITAPSDGATFNTSDTVTITASPNATTPATVTKVEFFDGANSIGTATGPFSITAQFAAGSHSLTAKVTDSTGATGVSGAVNITVNQPSNIPPTVSISTQAPTTTLEAPATFGLQANANDSDGTVIKVEYFDSFGGQNVSLGSSTAAPYPVTATFQAGKHVITAVATDNGGATTTSAPVNLNASVRPTLVIKKTSNTTYTITAAGTSGLTFTLEGTTQLPAGWTEISSLTASRGSTVTFTDTVAPETLFKFYRVVIK